MHLAPLPGRTGKALPDGGSQSFIGVGNNQRGRFHPSLL